MTQPDRRRDAPPTIIRVRASIRHFRYEEGERPPMGPPYRVMAEGRACAVLTTRPTRKEAEKVARAVRKALVGGS